MYWLTYIKLVINTSAELLNNYKETPVWLVYGNIANTDSILTSAYKILGSNNENHPDLYYIKQEKIAIEDAHSIIKFLYKTPAQSEYKIVIVNHLGRMNYNAINALLKIIEEPPRNNVIILLSNSLYGVPATIRSRCRKLYITNQATHNLNSPLYQKIIRHLKHTRVPNEELSFDELLFLLQLSLTRIMKVKLNCDLNKEIYTGETNDLKAYQGNIESIYKKWQNLLQLYKNKSIFYLSEQQVKILLFASKI